MTSEKQKLIKCGIMFDSVNEKFIPNNEILIDGNKIIAVGKKLEYDNTACEVIDLTDLLITPGLIDAHVHVDLEYKKLHDLPLLTSNEIAITITENLRKSLYNGFTTIRGMNMVGREYELYTVKKMQDRDLLKETARLIPSRLLGSEGSHADISNFLSLNQKLSLDSTSDTIGSGRDFFKKTVRNERKLGAEFIKFMYTGAFMKSGYGPDDLSLSDEEVEAIIETAHSLNLTATAHVFSKKAMQKLIKFGIDGMEHGLFADRNILKQMEAKDIYLVPTMTTFEDFIITDEKKINKMDDMKKNQNKKYAEKILKARQEILSSNVVLGYGTDLVDRPVYEGWHEFASWFDAGAPIKKILKAATISNARILKIEDEFGSLEVGKIADISGFPIKNIESREGIKNCKFVMKNGIVYVK